MISKAICWRHVRKAVGTTRQSESSSIPIATSAPRALRNATALVLLKEYPHVDVSKLADDLFTVMEGAIEGHTRPVMAAWDCRMIGVVQPARQPMRSSSTSCRR